MSKPIQWSGDNLNNLLTKSIDQLLKLYPYQTRKNLIRRKQEAIKRSRESIDHIGDKSKKRPIKKEDLNAFDRLLERSGVEIDDIDSITRMNIYQSSMKDEDGEWNTIDQYAMQIRPKDDKPEKYGELHATPARIVPSRRKPVKHDHKKIFVFGDQQIGYRRIMNYETGQEEMITTHDERAMAIARYICRDIQPETIVNLSDTIDFAELGRFDKDSDHFYRTLSPSFQRVHDWYAELRADNPNARIVEVASNHNERLAKFVLKHVPDMYGMQQASSNNKYPVLTYPFMANLKHVGVEWIAGYPSGEFVYGEEYGKPPIVFRHGMENSSNGTTASKVMKNHPETHNVHGHDHSVSEAWHTRRDGRSLGNFVVGALCKTTGIVPSYHSSVDDHGQMVHHQENWEQSVLEITDYLNGDYAFNTIMINDGVAYRDGKRYTADNQ